MKGTTPVAKQSNNGHVNGNNGDDRYTYPEEWMTSKGAKIRFIGLNPARLEMLQTAGQEPEKPFRMLENDLGAPQKEYLSADDLQTDEEKVAWQEYQEKLDILEKKRNENVMKYVFNDGFAVDETELEEWKREEEEEWGLPLPSSKIQLRMNFINARVIGNADDLGNVMAGVLERTGVPPEMLGEVRDSFRGMLRQDATPQVAGEEP